MRILYWLSEIKNNRYLHFFRVFDWLHILGLSMLGVIFASRINLNLSQVTIVLLISSLYLAHGYSLNECFDVNIKYKGDKQNLFSNSTIPFKTAVIFSYTILFLNIFISLFASKHIFALVLIGAIFAWLYSAYPMRLKEKPFLELMCNSLGFSILFLIGFASVRIIDIRAILMAGFIFFLFLPIQLIHELNHLEEDKIEGINTTVVKLGIRLTLNLIIFFLMMLISYAYALYYFFNIPFYFFVITIFFSLAFIWCLFRRLDRQSETLNTYRLKMNIKYLCIVYGIGILISFYFLK